MKKLLITIALFSAYSISVAQSDSTELKRIRFSFGISLPQLQGEFGFFGGLDYDIPLNNSLYLTPGVDVYNAWSFGWLFDVETHQNMTIGARLTKGFLKNDRLRIGTGPIFRVFHTSTDDYDDWNTFDFGLDMEASYDLKLRDRRNFGVKFSYAIFNGQEPLPYEYSYGFRHNAERVVMVGLYLGF